jgi:hypothetical protein
VARTIEPRSIYDARLTNEEIEARQKARDLRRGQTRPGNRSIGHE